MDWMLADAKNRFSELVTLALEEGPQTVRRRADEVVVMARKDYDKLTGKKEDFIEFLLSKGADFEGVDLTRDRSTMRTYKW